MGCSNLKLKMNKQCNIKDENLIQSQSNMLLESNTLKKQVIITSINQRRGYYLNSVPKLNLSSNDLYKRRKFKQLSHIF